MQAISNKYFRLIYNLDRMESVRVILKSHNVLNIHQNYNYHVCRLMHKAVNNELPNFLSDKLTTSNDYFFFKKPRLKRTENSIMFAAPKLWDNLPHELVSESNFNKFQMSLKTHVLNRNYF